MGAKRNPNKELTSEMLPAYKAKGTSGTKRAWYYVDHDSIEVYASAANTATHSVRLTRKQLERALEIMKAAE